MLVGRTASRFVNVYIPSVRRTAYSTSSIINEEMAAQKRKSEEEKRTENGKKAAGGQEKQDGKVEPPNTGWKEEVPNKDGGSDIGYLFKPPYTWHTKEFKPTYEAKCWCGKGKCGAG